MNVRGHTMRNCPDRRDLNMWLWTSRCLYARSAAASSKILQAILHAFTPRTSAKCAKYDNRA